MAANVFQIITIRSLRISLLVCVRILFSVMRASHVIPSWSFPLKLPLTYVVLSDHWRELFLLFSLSHVGPDCCFCIMWPSSA